MLNWSTGSLAANATACGRMIIRAKNKETGENAAHGPRSYQQPLEHSLLAPKRPEAPDIGEREGETELVVVDCREIVLSVLHAETATIGIVSGLRRNVLKAYGPFADAGRGRADYRVRRGPILVRQKVVAGGGAVIPSAMVIVAILKLTSNLVCFRSEGRIRVELVVTTRKQNLPGAVIHAECRVHKFPQSRIGVVIGTPL